jgi:hypothetical protein
MNVRPIRPISNLDVLDTTPAYVVVTSATNAAGAVFGQVRHFVARGQVAQYRLHCEPDHRTAERHAQGAHASLLTAGKSYAEMAASLPVIVTVLETTRVLEPAVGDVVVVDDEAELLRVAGVDVDMVRLVPVGGGAERRVEVERVGLPVAVGV